MSYLDQFPEALQWDGLMKPHEDQKQSKTKKTNTQNYYSSCQPCTCLSLCVAQYFFFYHKTNASATSVHCECINLSYIYTSKLNDAASQVIVLLLSF